jgi:hypothetical protein
MHGGSSSIPCAATTGFNCRCIGHTRTAIGGPAPPCDSVVLRELRGKALRCLQRSLAWPVRHLQRVRAKQPWASAMNTADGFRLYQLFSNRLVHRVRRTKSRAGPGTRFLNYVPLTAGHLPGKRYSPGRTYFTATDTILIRSG